MQARVLNRKNDGVLSSVIVMRMPQAGWCHKHCTGNPIGFHGVHDVPVRVDLVSDEGVGSGLGVHAEVDRNGVMPVWLLNHSGGEHVEERPEDMREGQCLWCRRVPQQNAHAVAVHSAWLVADVGQFLLKPLVGEERRTEPRFSGLDAQVT